MDCNSDDLRIPAKHNRVAVVQGLEEHLILSAGCNQEVVAILATFMLCSHCRTVWHWAFMVVLRNEMYCAVRIEDYAYPVGIDCNFSRTPHELRYWSIDGGGRVLMDMILDNFPGMVVTELQDFMQTLIESMIRIGSHKRRAFDGVAYPWMDFVQWYGYTQVLDAHWRTGGPRC